MRILAVWDNKSEADLISMYLSVDDNEVTMTTSPEEFRKVVELEQPTDIVLMTIGLPDPDVGFEVFEQVRQHYPEAPIVGALPAVGRLPRGAVHGQWHERLRDARSPRRLHVHAACDHGKYSRRGACRPGKGVGEEAPRGSRICPQTPRVGAAQASGPRPKVTSSVPATSPHRSVSSTASPVTLAGGDYYDVFTLPDNSIVLLVGDAAGHGMKSCLSIMTMHTLVRMMRRQEYQDTAHFVEEINKGLCRANHGHRKGRLYYPVVRHFEYGDADLAMVGRRPSAAAAAESFNRRDRTARRSRRGRPAFGC